MVTVAEDPSDDERELFLVEKPVGLGTGGGGGGVRKNAHLVRVVTAVITYGTSFTGIL